MLVPFRQMFHIRLSAPAEVSSITLESMLPITPILQPKIFFRNISGTDLATISVNHVLDFGVSDDPLMSGAWDTILLTEDLLPGELLWHVFPSVFLGEGNVRHEITLSTSGASADVIVHMWVEGLFEESLKTSPNYQPITI